MATCPVNSSTGLCDILTESGTGIGNLLSGLITGGLISFILIIAVIGGVVAIFYGIAHMITGSISKVKHR